MLCFLLDNLHADQRRCSGGALAISARRAATALPAPREPAQQQPQPQLQAQSTNNDNDANEKQEQQQPTNPPTAQQQAA